MSKARFIKPVSIVDSVLISSSIAETDTTAWSAATLYVAGDTVMRVGTNLHKTYTAAAGRKATVTMTIAAPGVVTWTAHALKTDDAIVFLTTGALPTGLTAGTTYYAKVVDQNTFQIAATAGGAAITTSGTQSGVHTCGLASGYNKTPESNPTSWIETGWTNRWKMFDEAVGSQSVGTTTLTVTLAPAVAVTSLWLGELSASSAQITMTDGAGGPTVYDKTYTIGDGAILGDWYDYFFAPLEPRTSLLVSDLPPYGSGRITVTLTAPVTAKCGTCVVGNAVELGDTLADAGVSIVDYSKKDTNTFGVTSVIERTFAKRIESQILVPNSRIDYVARQLSAVRATPCVWVIYDQREATVAYGFYKDWSIVIPFPTYSRASLTIEGLSQ